MGAQLKCKFCGSERNHASTELCVEYLLGVLEDYKRFFRQAYRTEGSRRALHCRICGAPSRDHRDARMCVEYLNGLLVDHEKEFTYLRKEVERRGRELQELCKALAAAVRGPGPVSRLDGKPVLAPEDAYRRVAGG